MSSNKRKLQYSLAINEALCQLMNADKNVLVMGQGTTSPWYVGKTCDRLKDVCEDRIFDTPISENAITGAAVGAAIVGMRPVVVHPRMDFMLYAMDPIINEAANWSHMFAGKSSVPVVIWGIINRKGEQGAQHSQSLHSIFSHIPGLKVVMPATAYDAKGLMVAAIKDDNPVVYIDDRSLYNEEDFVPKEIYSVPIGKAAVRTRGNDVTIIAISSMVKEALRAEIELKEKGIGVEVIDLRSAKPLDSKTIIDSANKTGRVVICDVGWMTGGLGAEIAAQIAESSTAKVKRIALPDAPAATSRTLENAYYPDRDDVVEAVLDILKK